MKTPIALLNLWQQGAKTLVSIGGVAFALLLVFMQLGFMGAVSHTATNVLDNLNFDIVIRARDYLHLYEASRLSRDWLAEVEGLSSVEGAEPLWITVHNMRTLQPLGAPPDQKAELLPVAVLAARPVSEPFVQPELNSALRQLRTGQSVAIDDSTQRAYGPANGKQFSEADIGRATEIGGQSFRVRDVYSLGTGLAANAAVLASEEGFARIMPWSTQDQMSLGLVRVRSDAPETTQAVADQISQLANVSATLGEPAVTVLTKPEALAWETRRWLWQTPIGLIFQLGVVLSLLVGAAIVYMVLSTDVSSRLPEYATLLAMGYSRKYLASIVMTQALTLCGLGLITAWIAAEGLYRVTTLISAIPLTMLPSRILLVSILGVLMCCISGLLALRKLWKAEPANLF